VVATSVGGIPEVVSHGADGYLTPPGDAPAMEKALASLRDDPGLRSRTGEGAARTARARFDSRDMVRAYADWYGEVLHAKV
jgi:glycosyltransferase involved in cell wall biosynthesis